MHGDTGMCPGRCSGFQLVDDAPTGTWVFGVNLPENALRFLLLSVERRCTAIRRFADIHDRSLSRENEVLPTRATEERANTITAEFSAAICAFSARAPAFRRTRHPFAVSGHLR